MKATASELLARLPGKVSEKWPQGERHRFENFTADFSTWVVFWGPKGGEKD